MSGFILDKVSRVIEGKHRRFRHVFGGPARHKGVIPKGCKVPLHHLYTFDMSDPAFPVKIPGVRYLPLYFSFTYNAGSCGYRVKSESEIEVLFMETKKLQPDFPYENYPAVFPERAVRLAPISYDQHKTLTFFVQTDRWSLSRADRKVIFDDLRYPFTQLGGFQRMWQDIPRVRCPNSKCTYSRYTSALDVFAVVWNEPHPGVFLWDPLAGNDDDVQVIFLICPECKSIHACNRCT